MRLFIAIDFNDKTKSAFFNLSSELMRQADSGRIVPLENYHLTLAFIGQTQRLQDAQEAMAAVCIREFTEPLPISFWGIGSFKGRKGHTWWVGVKDNPALTRLANHLTEELRSTGFDIDRRTFKPHITIGRAVVSSRPIDLQLSPLEFVASKVSLMHSDLKNGHPLYRELFTCNV